MCSMNIIVFVVLLLDLSLIISVSSKKKGAKRNCRLADINRLKITILDRIDLLHSEDKCLAKIKDLEAKIVALEKELADQKAVNEECPTISSTSTAAPPTTPTTTQSFRRRTPHTEFPEIVQHPEDTFALVGDTVNLTCRAVGKPRPDTYQWFKNGKLLQDQEQTGQNLVIVETTLENKGSYYCKASSEYGSAKSNAATLDVKEDSESFCDSQPVSFLKALPKDCPQSGESPLVYDVGRCQKNVCVKRPKANSDTKFCCGPTKQTKETLACVDYSMDIIVTLECGCVICNQVNISGNIVTSKRDVTFSGVVHAINDPSTVLRFGNVYLFDERVTTTSFNGEFSFSVPTGMNRIVVTFKEGVMKSGFIEASKVFTIPKDFSGTLFEDVSLLINDKVITITPSEKNTISLAESSESSTAEVIIPGDSFYDSDGNLYTDEVKVTVNFIDPSNIDSFNSMVGDLTFVNDNGEVGLLKTFGMFHLGFNGENGEELELKADVGMAIRADVIGAEFKNTTNVKLWSLNPSSARWEYEGSLERVSASRRKRAQTLATSDFFVGKTVITDRYWFNFDDDSLNFCYVRIKAYTDSSLSTLLPWSETFEPSVLTPASSVTPPNGRVLTGSMSQTGSGFGSKDDCILTVCGESKFQAYLFLKSDNVALSASSKLGAADPTIAGVNINVKQLDDVTTATRSRVIETDVEPLVSNGPLYHSNTAPDCKDASLKFCTDCEINNYMGAECFLCDPYCYNPIPSMTAYSQCLKASDSDPHYSFYRNPSTLFEYSVCDMAMSCLGGNPPLTPLAWFPQTTIAFWAWFIKVRVLVKRNGQDTDDESRVRVMSKGGEHEDTKGKLFGIREDVTSSQSVCVEYKGSGPILTLSKPGVDETVIEISVEGTQCSVDENDIAVDLRQYKVDSPSPTNEREPLISFQIPGASIVTGNTFGRYVDDDDDLETAKKRAKSRCECSDPQRQKLTCDNPDSDGGEAIIIKCKDYDYPVYDLP
ncbi:unnamed protein product [Owenia fusiformis]|uniref:Ig-like domain-containing protein n=1 Tax=Owenia fusiformis TaxID=6347 RepID=A0A8S4PMY1_OWEFU|nr:unnamed protein product [Owenia fusiformis]